MLKYRIDCLPAPAKKERLRTILLVNFLNTVQFVQHFLFFIQREICNLDHLVTCGIPYANTYGIPRNSGIFYCKKYHEIPRNFAEFRMFFKNSVFRQKSKTHFRGHPMRDIVETELYHLHAEGGDGELEAVPFLLHCKERL